MTSNVHTMVVQAQKEEIAVLEVWRASPGDSSQLQAKEHHMMYLDQSYCSKKPVGSSSVTITEFLSTQKSISLLHLGVDPQSL